MADYTAIKALCNDPKVRERLSDTVSEIDPERFLAEPRNVILFDGLNAMFFLWRWVGIYEVHILFRSRGWQALAACRQMIGAVFNEGAGMLLAVIPADLRHVQWFARQFGFQRRGEIETIEGRAILFQLEATQWGS